MMRVWSAFGSYKARAGVGIVVVYTAYTGYVHLRTTYEISERERKKEHDKDIERYVF